LTGSKQKTTRYTSSDRTVKAAYEVRDTFLQARREAGLTQAQIGKRMGMTAWGVASLEGLLVSETHSPSIATLRRYAAACGKTLRILLV
jgi:transcriptional regulator with XRE-family HTH domain